MEHYKFPLYHFVFVCQPGSLCQPIDQRTHSRDWHQACLTCGSVAPVSWCLVMVEMIEGDMIKFSII
jgi:hypothetical protein